MAEDLGLPLPVGAPDLALGVRMRQWSLGPERRGQSGRAVEPGASFKMAGESHEDFPAGRVARPSAAAVGHSGFRQCACACSGRTLSPTLCYV